MYVIAAAAGSPLPVLLDSPLAVAAVANGLLAGLFFAFSCAVTPALRRVDDGTFVRTFQAINRAILNGWFLLVFVAAPLAAVAAGVLSLWQAGISPSAWVAAGVAGSLLTFLITAARNVPLNNRLDGAPGGTPAELSAARHAFERPWNRWNLARTLTSCVAFTCFVVAGFLG